MEFIIFLIALFYPFLLWVAFSSDPKTKYYNKMLQSKSFVVHFLTHAAYAITGLYYTGSFFACTPVATLVLLKLINVIVQKKKGRNVYLIAKGDKMPADRFKYEAAIPVALLLICFFIPFMIYINMH